MEMTNDVLLAQLLSLGLELKQARAAVAAGNTTVEQATEWIFENGEQLGQQPTATSPGALRLRPDEDLDDVELQRAIALSTAPAPQGPAQTSTTIEGKKSPIKINIIRAGQASQYPPPQPQGPSPVSPPSTAASPASSSTAAAATTRPPYTNTKREREAEVTSAISSGVTPLLPLLTSRQKEAEFEAENARLKKEAEKLAEKSKKLKQLEREARQRALQAIREDRENLRHKQAAPPSAESSSSPPLSSTSMATSAQPPVRTTTMVQLRLKNGTVLKRSFDNTATLQHLFDAVRQEDPSLSAQDVRLIQPFPRREFGEQEAQQTLQEAGLCPSCSLNIHVPPSANPTSPATLAPPMSLPGSWQPSQPPFAQTDDDEPEPMDIDEQEEDEEDGVDEESENDEEDEDDNGSDEEDEEDNAEEDDGLMHILPVGHGHGPPFGGRGRGRGGVMAARGGRGRGGIPFSGTGHRLSSGSGSAGGPSGSSSSGAGGSGGGGGDGDDDRDDTPAPMSDAERRQRVLDAMAARAAQQATATEAAGSSVGKAHSSSTVHSGASDRERQKSGPVRSIPSLLSRSTYEVAVLLTANDTKRTKYLRNLADIGSQAAELIVQDLIRLKQLDQLTVKRMGRCPIVNLSLDGYSRATDSLLETLRWTQAQSLSYLSLRGCPLLTDAGFQQIAAFHELEHLDLSNCRFTDANLVYLLELSELRVLSLSSTKVTTRGIGDAVTKASWAKHLHTLDLSFCEGIQGPAVLHHLQLLTSIRNLRLNNTRAFDHGAVLVPDSLGFTKLQELDLARTMINDDDLKAVRKSFPALELLNLTGCSRLRDASLESLCSGEDGEVMAELTCLKFPDRESGLRNVLPRAAEQFPQLNQMDLTGFLNLTDDTILSLGVATNLTMLSLAGTKLTDAGSPVLANLTLLREINLDRTAIQDKSIAHLRGLGRLEIISLSRCPGLTVEAIKFLSYSASFERTLKRLNLGYNSQIHDEALFYLKQAHSLMSLNLEYTDVTTARARWLADQVDALKQLRIVGVTEGERLQERGIYAMASSMFTQGSNDIDNDNNMQTDDDDDDDDDDNQ